jgi:hypothetical protein
LLFLWSLDVGIWSFLNSDTGLSRHIRLLGYSA